MGVVLLICTVYVGVVTLAFVVGMNPEKMPVTAGLFMAMG
jgi:hypothetical protein